MTPPEYPRTVYRPFSKKALRQGDIAVCEFSQLRARSGESPGPGDLEDAGGDLPYFGEPTDHELEIEESEGSGGKRIVRVWRGLVMVVSQNCEIAHANESDSRLLVAPLASANQWQEARWGYLRKNRLPGYLYLPTLEASNSEEALHLELGEGAVVLASISQVSRALVRGRRIASLTQEMLPLLQEKLSRFMTTRGYAGRPELEALAGKRILTVEQTDEKYPGPSRLYKVTMGGGGDDDGDDEVTVGFTSRP